MIVHFFSHDFSRLHEPDEKKLIGIKYMRMHTYTYMHDNLKHIARYIDIATKL